MFILIKVDAREGEESCWLTEIRETELEEMRDLILEIQKNSGYFPTRTTEDDPRPDLLYSGFPGYNNLVSRLPTPISGYKKIVEIHIFYETPISLYM